MSFQTGSYDSVFLYGPWRHYQSVCYRPVHQRHAADGAQATLDIDRLDRLLDDLSTTRRMTEQFVKAARSLNSLTANDNTHAILDEDIMESDGLNMGSDNGKIS